MLPERPIATFSCEAALQSRRAARSDALEVHKILEALRSAQDGSGEPLHERSVLRSPQQYEYSSMMLCIKMDAGVGRH